MGHHDELKYGTESVTLNKKIRKKIKNPNKS